MWITAEIIVSAAVLENGFWPIWFEKTTALWYKYTSYSNFTSLDFLLLLMLGRLANVSFFVSSEERVSSKNALGLNGCISNECTTECLPSATPSLFKRVNETHQQSKVGLLESTAQQKITSRPGHYSCGLRIDWFIDQVSPKYCTIKPMTPWIFLGFSSLY